MPRSYLPNWLNEASGVGLPALWVKVPNGREYLCSGCGQKKTGARYVKTHMNEAWRGLETRCPDCQNKGTSQTQEHPQAKQPARRRLPS